MGGTQEQSKLLTTKRSWVQISPVAGHFSLFRTTVICSIVGRRIVDFAHCRRHFGNDTKLVCFDSEEGHREEIPWLG